CSTPIGHHREVVRLTPQRLPMQRFRRFPDRRHRERRESPAPVWRGLLNSSSRNSLCLGKTTARNERPCPCVVNLGDHAFVLESAEERACLIEMLNSFVGLAQQSEKIG